MLLAEFRESAESLTKLKGDLGRELKLGSPGLLRGKGRPDLDQDRNPSQTRRRQKIQYNSVTRRSALEGQIPGQAAAIEVSGKETSD